MYSAFMGGLVGIAVAGVLFLFEYIAVVSASTEPAKRRASERNAFDQSERARLRNLGWFCVKMPLIFAALGWLLR